TYSGKVPGVIAGHYLASDAQFDLSRLAREAGAEFVQGTVVRLDTTAKQAVLGTGDAIAYDYASLNLGSTPDGAGGAAIPVKPFAEFFSRWQGLLEKGPRAPRIA